MGKMTTYPLRLTASLKTAVLEICREDNTSINQFVSVAVAEKVSAVKTAEFFAKRRDQADIEAALRVLRREDGEPGPCARHQRWPEK